jgi:hypothetical protein
MKELQRVLISFRGRNGGYGDEERGCGNGILERKRREEK